jgi:hypothetical protein
VVVVITIIVVITMIAITAKSYLRAKSATLLLVISILVIKVVGLVVYTSLISLKESLRGCVVNTQLK